MSEAPISLQNAEREIYLRLPTAIKSNCNVGEILLSVPAPPKLKKDNAFIQAANDSAPEPIEEFFPLEQWTDAYSHNKWKSFVFAPKHIGAAVRDAAISVLRDMFGVEVIPAKSNLACYL